MNISLDLNKNRISGKTTSNKVGLFISQDWKRLIDPYTPRDTGQLMGITGVTVDIEPFKLRYRVPYAEKVYYGENMEFQKNNPYSTHHWDIAAANAGKLDILYKDVNTALKLNKI